MFAPVKHTMPAISMEYQRALMETQVMAKLIQLDGTLVFKGQIPEKYTTNTLLKPLI